MSKCRCRLLIVWPVSSNTSRRSNQPPGVVGVQPGGGHGIDRLDPLVQRLWTGQLGPLDKACSQLVVDRRAGVDAAQQRGQIQRRAADEQHFA